MWLDKPDVFDKTRGRILIVKNGFLGKCEPGFSSEVSTSMDDPMNITVCLFGPFRGYEKNDELMVQTRRNRTILELLGDIKETFCLRHPDFTKGDLFVLSAVGSRQDILKSHDVVGDYTELALLPPVCGG